MSVSRQFNWLGQMRVDVPHLRTIDSSNANDFDTLAGIALAGQQSLVVNGFLLITSNAVGQPATNLQLQVDPGVIWHYNASENGSIFRTPVGTAPQQLTSTNPVVLGSFTAGQLNYVGLDLQRSSDPSTSDLVEFLDADTLVEDPETVPLARTLNYVIVISTSDFTSQPNVLPLALVTTDASNNVLSLQDARQMAFRLGSGGTTPSPYNTYAFSQGRNELQNSDGFSGGDKAFTSLHDAIQGIETRVRELGGGSFWYSTAADRQVKFTRNLATRFANGDNFELYPSTSAPTDLLWQGLSFVFCNSGNATIYQNAIADQATPLAGLTNLAPGECIYVDINELEQIPTGLTALQPQKANMATLGVALAPFTRWVIAWCVSSTPVNNYFTLDSQFGVGTILAPASTTANGVVELNTSSQAPTQPVVVVADASGNAIATGLSRGNGGLPQFSSGILAIGYGTDDTTISIGNSTNVSQLIQVGAGPNIGGHTTMMDGNIISIGVNSTNPAITIGSATADTTTLQAQTVNLTSATNVTSNLNAFSGTAAAYTGNFNIFSNLTGGVPSGSVFIGNNNGSNLWNGAFVVGDAVYAGISPAAQSATFVGLAGGFLVYTSPVLLEALSFTGVDLSSWQVQVEPGSTMTALTQFTTVGIGSNLARQEYIAQGGSSGAVTEMVSIANGGYSTNTPSANSAILNLTADAAGHVGGQTAYANLTAQNGTTAVGWTTSGPAAVTITAASQVQSGHNSGQASITLQTITVGTTNPFITLQNNGPNATLTLENTNGGSINLITTGGTINIGAENYNDPINIGVSTGVNGGVVTIASTNSASGTAADVYLGNIQGGIAGGSIYIGNYLNTVGGSNFSNAPNIYIGGNGATYGDSSTVYISACSSNAAPGNIYIGLNAGGASGNTIQLGVVTGTAAGSTLEMGIIPGSTTNIGTPLSAHGTGWSTYIGTQTPNTAGGQSGYTQVAGDFMLLPDNGVPSNTFNASGNQGTWTTTFPNNTVVSHRGTLQVSATIPSAGSGTYITHASPSSLAPNNMFQVASIQFGRPFYTRDGGLTGAGAGPFVILGNTSFSTKGTDSSGAECDVTVMFWANPTYNGSNQLKGFDLYVSFAWYTSNSYDSTTVGAMSWSNWPVTWSVV